jgi:hypothetical protein
MYVLTDQDFKEHPALEDLVIRNKKILISHGIVIDTLLWLNTLLKYQLAGFGNSKFSGNRVSWEEAVILKSKYSRFAYNNTPYVIAMTQCWC